MVAMAALVECEAAGLALASTGAGVGSGAGCVATAWAGCELVQPIAGAGRQPPQRR